MSVAGLGKHGFTARAPRGSSRRGGVGQIRLAAHDPETHPVEQVGDLMDSSKLGEDARLLFQRVNLPAWMRPDLMWSWTHKKIALRCLARPTPLRLPIAAPASQIP